MKKRALNLALAALLTASALTGCGFQLRGAVDPSTFPAAVRIEAPLALRNAVRALQDELQRAGATLAPDDDPTATTLALSDGLFERRTLSVDGATHTVGEYRVTYTLEWALYGVDGARLEGGRVEREGVYSRNNAGAVGGASKEGLLNEQLIRDAARDIVNALRR